MIEQDPIIPGIVLVEKALSIEVILYQNVVHKEFKDLETIR